MICPHCKISIKPKLVEEKKYPTEHSKEETIVREYACPLCKKSWHTTTYVPNYRQENKHE